MVDQLGDNDQWSKVTCFEHATRIPLIIKPAVAGSSVAGSRALGLVETVDIMPSLVALAIPGKVIPRCPNTLEKSRATMLCTDGRPNLVTALHRPSANLSRAAFSQIPRDKLVQGMSGAGPPPHELFMGYSVRTDQWRYTEWHPFNATTGVADWNTVVGLELYAHGNRTSQQQDCTWDYENVNYGTAPQYEHVRQSMAAELRTIVADV